MTILVSFSDVFQNKCDTTITNSTQQNRKSISFWERLGSHENQRPLELHYKLLHRFPYKHYLPNIIGPSKYTEERLDPHCKCFFFWRPDTWCSAKVLACHAAGPGSIPGRGNKDALISHKSITWSLGLDRAPSFGAGLRSSVSDPS